MSNVKDSRPVIFNFQPTEIEWLESPDEIKHWEDMMRNYVGIKAENFERSGSCSECKCGNPPKADDCDQD